MHEKLLENYKKLSRSDIEEYAEELGLDMQAFRSSLDTNAHKDMIDADVKQAMELGATGTPAFFVNGRYMRGAQPFDAFKERIEEILKQK